MIDRLLAAARRLRARFGTVRAATTAVATVPVSIALVVGATALIAALRHTLIDEVEEASRAQAVKVARQLETGPPPILQIAGSEDEQLIQVLGPDGSVVASSPNVAGKPPVAQLQPGESEQVVTPSTTTNSSPSQ